MISFLLYSSSSMIYVPGIVIMRFLTSESCFIGFDGTANDWDDYSRYTNSDGVEMTSVSFCFYIDIEFPPEFFKN